MGIVLKILKWVGIILVVIIVLAVLFLFWLSKRPFVPTNYTSAVTSGGPIEAKYLAMGDYKTKCLQTEAPMDWGKFIIHYPLELESKEHKYPVVVFVNGTGVYASKYPALFEHLASWGFIVTGNEDPSTYTGDSADGTLAYLLKQNEDPDSVFYEKVDTDNIGISGHSQGGVGVFNAISSQEHSDLYKCAVSLSPTQKQVADALGMAYDPQKTAIPTLLLAATENDVITLEGMKELFAAIDAPKAMALHTDVDHGKMLYCADGYVTAWFRWLLQDDKDAAKAFIGEDPEMLTNTLYHDQCVILKTEWNTFASEVNF